MGDSLSATMLMQDIEFVAIYDKHLGIGIASSVTHLWLVQLGLIVVAPCRDVAIE